MKRKAILLFTMIFAAFMANAQITINYANHPAPVTASDTLVLTSNVGLSVPTKGANQTWNYGHLKDSLVTGLHYYSYNTWQAGTNSMFATGSRYYTQENIIAGKLVLYTDEYETDNNTADAYTGYAVSNPQGYSLTTVTGGGNDSLAFPVQTYVYPKPDVIISYPATFNSHWGSQSRAVTNFSLTVAAAGLNHTASAKVSNRTRIDTVISWGALNVPFGETTGQSQYDSVLEVKESIMEIDSYYIGGLPAPSTLLGYFGLKNADTTLSDRYVFYRAAYNQPLLEVYMDTDPWKTPMYAAYDKNNTVYMGIDLRGQEVSFASTSYPNPVTNGILNLQFNKTSPGRWTITVSDMMGQTVNSVELTKGEGNVSTQVAMPQSAVNGLYIYSIKANDGSVSQGKFILNR